MQIILCLDTRAHYHQRRGEHTFRLDVVQDNVSAGKNQSYLAGKVGLIN